MKLSPLFLAALLCAAPAFATDTSKAQPILPKEDLVIVTHDGKPHLFHVEMAVTPDQQEIGLMWRTALAADSGMLFTWDPAQVSTMWMKNTLIPLDMVFVDDKGNVAAITEHAVPHSLAIISSNVAVKGTIELPDGTAEALDIRVGDKVKQRVFGNN